MEDNDLKIGDYKKVEVYKKELEKQQKNEKKQLKKLKKQQKKTICSTDQIKTNRRNIYYGLKSLGWILFIASFIVLGKFIGQISAISELVDSLGVNNSGIVTEKLSKSDIHTISSIIIYILQYILSFFGLLVSSNLCFDFAKHFKNNKTDNQTKIL